VNIRRFTDERPRLVCLAWSRRSAQKPLRAEIFVKVGPVNAVAATGNYPVQPLLRSGIQQRWIPREGHCNRPSFRATLSAESVKETSATRSSAPSAKIPMPSLQKLPLVLYYDAMSTKQLDGTISCAAPRASRVSVPCRQTLRYSQPVWLQRGFCFLRPAESPPESWSQR
jgi:hypothetical protein